MSLVGILVANSNCQICMWHVHGKSNETKACVWGKKRADDSYHVLNLYLVGWQIVHAAYFASPINYVYHDCLPRISHTHFSFSFTTTWASKTYGKTRCSLVLYLQRQLTIMKDHLKATLSLAHWSLHFSFYGDSVMVSSTHLTSTFKMSLESVSYKRKSAFKETWISWWLVFVIKGTTQTTYMQVAYFGAYFIISPM